MIKEALLNPRKKIVSDLARSGMKVSQDNSFLNKIYDPNGQGGQKESIKQKKEAYSPYLPRYKKNQRSFSVKEKRISNPEVNQSQIAGLQDKIFADLENFENSPLIESGRSSQASIVQNYFEENPISSAGMKRFDNLPFGKDIDLFRQKFKRAFPNHPDKPHDNKSPNSTNIEYKLRKGKVSLQVKPRTQSVYTHSIRTNLILKQFQNARSKQNKDRSKRTTLNTSESGIKKRGDLNQSFGPTHHNNSFLQKALQERNQSFDYPSKNTKTDLSMDDSDEKCRSRSPLLGEKYVQKINLGRLRSAYSKDNTSFYQPSSSKERIVNRSFKQKHNDLDPMPVIFSSAEKDSNSRMEKRHHHRSLVINEGDSSKLKNSKHEYSDLLNKILHETEKPKYLDPEVAKQENKRKEWLAAFEEKKAQLRNYYKNLQQKKTRDKLHTEPDYNSSKTMERSFGDVSSIKSIYEPNQPQQDFQPLPIGTSWGPSEIHKKYFLGGKNLPQRKILLR